MDIRFNNKGLSNQQIEYLDGLSKSNHEIVSQISGDNASDLYSLSVNVAEVLAERGIDTNDPKIFAAVVFGATIQLEVMDEYLPDNDIIFAAGSLVIGAMLAARPIHTVE